MINQKKDIVFIVQGQECSIKKRHRLYRSRARMFNKKEIEDQMDDYQTYKHGFFWCETPACDCENF